VVNFAGVDRVFVVQNKTVVERIVRLGRRFENGTVEVVSGLNPGDLMIAEPSDKLPAGQSVEVQGG